jgi:fimbrial chaperone protein
MNRFLILLALPFLFSFSFSPMSQSIDLSSGRKGAQFLIENEGKTNIAVELTVKERVMAEDGTETLKDTKEVTVFPPQIIIPPGEKRTIRASFLSKDEIKVEKNYRVIAEQLPLKVDEKIKNKSGIQMLMKYVAALYATPEDAKSSVKVVSYSTSGGILTLGLENSGDKHQLINNPVLTFSLGGKKEQFKAQELAGLTGENVLAGHKRIFKIKTQRPIPSGAKVELKFEN